MSAPSDDKSIGSHTKAGEALLCLLRRNLSELLIKESSAVISFSGGLDSTLIAKLCLEIMPIKGIVAGSSGSNDLINAEKASKILDFEISTVQIYEHNLMSAIRQMMTISKSADPILISFEIPIFISMLNTSEETILTGQGADELFGGYAKYAKLVMQEFIEERDRDIDRLFASTVPFEDNLASHIGKKIARPFLSREIQSLARTLRPELIYPAGSNKEIIRDALRQLGLMDISFTSKKAAQYGSGTMNLMRKIAKKKGTDVRGLIEMISEEVG